MKNEAQMLAAHYTWKNTLLIYPEIL